MKHLFSIIMFGFLIFPQPTFAGAVIGATEPTQWLNNIELAMTNISSAGTQVSTYQTALKGTILDPIANQLINAALQSASNDIIAWANGGFNGEPLIVSDPGKFIQNQGLKSVKINLNLIPEGSAFGDSIFNSLARNYAYENTDMKTKLADLSKSGIPAIVQNEMCDNASLTAYALEDIIASDGTYDEEALAARKNELYEYAACDGDINDPEVQSRLQDLAKENPSLGGWDRWLAVTGGDNDFTRGAKAQQLVEEVNAKEKYKADRELYDGLNAISQTICSEYSQPQEGEDRSCIGTQGVATPGDIVTALVSKASTAGLDRLTNIMGDGSISSLLQGFATQYLINGLNEALNPSAGSNSNNSTAVITPRSIKPDLAGNPSGKAGLVQPMMRQFTTYQTSLSSLETLDRNYLNDVALYEQKVEAGAQCYAQLVQDGLVSPQDPRVLFYDNRRARINQAKTSINAELPKISEAKTLVAQTISKIGESNSTQEISDIFNAYMSAIETRGLPTMQAEAVRKGEINKNTSDMARDTDVVTYYNQCVQLRAPTNVY